MNERILNRIKPLDPEAPGSFAVICRVDDIASQLQGVAQLRALLKAICEYSGVDAAEIEGALSVRDVEAMIARFLERVDERQQGKADGES